MLKKNLSIFFKDIWQQAEIGLTKNLKQNERSEVADAGLPDGLFPNPKSQFG
jgi:hypothetical protein